MHKKKDSKTEVLRKDGVLNPHPETVEDELFHKSEFFDPKDMVQVKYEMVRRVSKEDYSVTNATKKFGFSRPSFYQAKALIKSGGLSALVPKRRGPREAHKLSNEIMDFVDERLKVNKQATPKELALTIKERFRIEVHPRSVERALQRRKKKNRSTR